MCVTIVRPGRILQKIKKLQNIFMHFDILPLICPIANVLLRDLRPHFVKKIKCEYLGNGVILPKNRKFRTSVLPSVRRVRPTVRPLRHPAVRRSFRPSVHPAVRPSVGPSRPSIHPAIRPFVVFVCPSVRHPSVRSSRLSVRRVHPSIPFSLQSVLPFVCSSLRLSVRTSVRPAGHPSVGPIHPSVRARPVK